MPRVTVKQQVLALLNTHRGSYYSGQELADQLGVTRAAVWKAINALRESGYAIDGTTNRGYALAASTDLLTAADITALLTPEAAALFRVECIEKVDSTNSALRDKAVAEEPQGLVLVAEEQTAGRGRRGRVFYSPKGTGLYFSLLLRPTLPAAEAVQLTAAAAVAAAAAAEEVRPQLGRDAVQIKWVNDLFLSGRKICGILTEAMLSLESGGLDHAILGVGFNLCPPPTGWPAELTEVAGSLFPGEPPIGSRAHLVAAFLNHFAPLYTHLSDFPHLEEYRRRQLVLGRTIEVIQPQQPPRTAKALAIDDQCRLVLRFAGETEPKALNSGEVRISKLKVKS